MRERRTGRAPRRRGAAPVRSRATVKSPMSRYRIPTKARKRYVASKRTEGSPSDDAADLAARETTTSAVREGLARELLVRARRASPRSGRRRVMIRSPAARPAARRRAVGLDRPQDERAAVAVATSKPAAREACRPCGQTRRSRARPLPRVSATSATITSLFATRFTGVDSAIRMPLSSVRIASSKPFKNMGLRSCHAAAKDLKTKNLNIVQKRIGLRESSISRGSGAERGRSVG